MSCPHSLKSLLARTDFAKDGNNVHRAIEDRELAVRVSEENMIFHSPKSNLAVPMLNTTVVSRPQPISHHANETRCIRDDGPRLRLFKDAKLLRDYADYKHSHGAVYDAIIDFLGDRTFSDGVKPSDALALVVGAALVLSICENVGFTENMSVEARQRADIFSNIVLPFNEGTIYVCKSNLSASKELRQQLCVAHGIIVSSLDPTSSYITDMLWCLCAEVTFLVMLSKCAVIGSTQTDDFMKFVSIARGVQLSTATPASITAQGCIQYCGNTYKAVGYCQDGVMLGLMHKGIDSSVLSLEVKDLVFRSLGHHNVRSSRDACAGCSAAFVKRYGDFVQCTNPLVCCDLNTGSDFVVSADGTISFSAQTLLYDKQRGKVLRTVRKHHVCEAYDVHSLLGFDLETSENLSSLFPSDTEGQIGVLAVEGIRVCSTLQRVDNYEVDSNGGVTSITHGGFTKSAQISATGRIWGHEGGSSFLFEDMVG